MNIDWEVVCNVPENKCWINDNYYIRNMCTLMGSILLQQSVRARRCHCPWTFQNESLWSLSGLSVMNTSANTQIMKVPHILQRLLGTPSITSYTSLPHGVSSAGCHSGYLKTEAIAAHVRGSYPCQTAGSVMTQLPLTEVGPPSSHRNPPGSSTTSLGSCLDLKKCQLLLRYT